ncbi:MAG: hypothetical protein JWM85_3641 [Acidimicrobiaceae bacterium]|nr:hypothetical protein [Acidimicrobiaceae bacterium]
MPLASAAIMAGRINKTNGIGYGSSGMSDIQVGMDLERRLSSLEKFQWEHEANEGAHAVAFDAHGMSPGPVEDAEQLAGVILDTATETAAVVPEVSTEGLEAATEDISEAAEEAIDAITEAGEAAVEAVGEAVPEPEAEEAVEDESNTVAFTSTGEPVKERAPKREHLLHRKMFAKSTNEG